MTVAAIVVGSGAAPSPSGVSHVVSVATVAGVTDAARETSASLLWLLDAGAEPVAATLTALLAAAPGPVASLPVDADRRPHEDLLGGFGDGDTARLLDAVQERRIPLRYLPVVSLLVAREDVLAHKPPDVERFGPYAGVEWTARLFAERAGFLIPASIVVLRQPPRFRAPLAAGRLVRTGAWRRTDALRPARLAINRLLKGAADT